MNSQRLICFVLMTLTSVVVCAVQQDSGEVVLPEATIEKLFKKASIAPAPDPDSTLTIGRESSEDETLRQVLGEDIGERGEDDDLRMVSQQIQYHLQLLQHHASGKLSEGIEPLQFDILRRLDSLIEGKQGSVASAVVTTPTEGLAGQEAGVGTIGETAENEVTAGVASEGADLLESNWNQLPPVVQIPLRESVSQPFLPGYEHLLQQFYNNLKKN